MRYNTILENISARPLYVFAFFLSLLVLMHLVLVLWLKLSDQAWKRIDYAWLALAALGLLSASAQADHFLSRRYLDTFERPRTESAYKWLRSAIDTYPGLCAPRNRTAASPPDFDAMVQEQQSLCNRAKEIAARMPSKVTPPFPTLEQTGYEAFDQKVKYETWYVQFVTDAAEQYRQQQNRYNEFVAATVLSDAEEIMTVLGPFLLAFALALRITKVTGDIRNMRGKNISR